MAQTFPNLGFWSVRFKTFEIICTRNKDPMKISGLHNSMFRPSATLGTVVHYCVHTLHLGTVVLGPSRVTTALLRTTKQYPKVLGRH